jgi:hypothetical protein
MTMHTLTSDSIITSEGDVIPRDLRDPAYVAWCRGVDPNPTAESLVAHLQFFMDRMAREHGYDDLKTAITYRGDPNPKFAAEAEAFFMWRSSIWTLAYQRLALVGAGEATLPTLEEAISMLPLLSLEQLISAGFQ